MNNINTNTGETTKAIQSTKKTFLNIIERKAKMRTIKVISGYLILILTVLITGCSENMTSLVNSTSPENSGSNETLQTGAAQTQKDAVYSLSLKIQPGENLFLDSKVTSLVGIKSFSISNCNPDREDLYVTSSNLDRSGSIGCSWSSNTNFMLADLSIKNNSGKVKEINVILAGRELKRN
ncbi:MAG TPA: hypothetical protein PKD83_12830 [Ignavibacteria bacterium]|nr:hypothetical protein [Ignavibacteria bacterium]